jgi:hypothetical protein
MAIEIDDDVPLPQPEKPDTWVTGKTAADCAAKFDNPLTEFRGFNPPQPGPNDCTFIGGPLNGKFGPIKGNAKTVEIEIYNADGSVASVELYALGDTHPTPTFRYWIGSKPNAV